MKKTEAGYILIPVEAISPEVCDGCAEFELETSFEVDTAEGADRYYRCAHVTRCRHLLERARKEVADSDKKSGKNG